MVLVAWFKELKRGGTVVNQGFLVGLLDHVKQWLLDLLSCSDPSFPTKGSVDSYAELSRTYSKMRNEANHLLFSAQSAGIDKDYISNIKFDWKSLTVDEAINFASSLTLPAESSLPENLEKHLLDDMESAKRQLLSTSGYLKCVQVLVLQIISSFCLFSHHIFCALFYYCFYTMNCMFAEQLACHSDGFSCCCSGLDVTVTIQTQSNYFAFNGSC